MTLRATRLELKTCPLAINYLKYVLSVVNNPFYVVSLGHRHYYSLRAPVHSETRTHRIHARIHLLSLLVLFFSSFAYVVQTSRVCFPPSYLRLAHTLVKSAICSLRIYIYARYMCVCVYIYRERECVCVYIYMRTCTCIRTYIHIYVHVYTDIHRCMCIYMCMREWVALLALRLCVCVCVLRVWILSSGGRWL